MPPFAPLIPLLRPPSRLHLVQKFSGLMSAQRLFTSGANKLDAVVLNAYIAPSAIDVASTTPLSLVITDDTVLNDETRGHILAQLASSRASGKLGEVRLLYGINELEQVAVVGLGKKTDDHLILFEKARQAAANGVRALRDYKVSNIGVDVSLDAHAASEGSHLALFNYDELKSPSLRIPSIALHPIGSSLSKNTSGLNWETGALYAESQNFARTLMETPANLMTPTIFTEKIVEKFKGVDKVEIFIRDEKWAEERNMGSFLSVGRGSDEPSKFLEIHYRGGKENEQPLGFVGKGVTFDTGGISIKPSAKMALMKGDMGGAASVVAAIYGISKLGLPINIVAATPLVENMPSGKAVKPGDVVRAMNGKTIEIDNTDAEGRLILADALYYISSTYKPHTLIDLATLTGAMNIALGKPYAGVFTNSDSLWAQLDQAGQETHDRFWRMPLHNDYLRQMRSHVADLVNSSEERTGGSCTAAIFLKEFVAGLDVEGVVNEIGDVSEGGIRWAHIDIAGVMDSKESTGYKTKGMTGRPTRSLIEFVRRLTR